MEYIIDFNPVKKEELNNEEMAIIEGKIKQRKSLTNQEAELFLDAINYITRKNINPNMDNFDWKCDLAQSILCHYLNKIDCPNFPCMTQSVITDSIEGHSFVTIVLIVEDEEKIFLLDPTYIQFFKKENCTADKLFVSPKFPDKVLLKPHPGYYIKDEDKEVASYLLNHGHILLNERVARMYGDSFYNTKTGVSPNEPFVSMSGNIYLRSFLKGKENLSKTEEELIANGLDIKTFESLKRPEKII